MINDSGKKFRTRGSQNLLEAHWRIFNKIFQLEAALGESSAFTDSRAYPVTLSHVASKHHSPRCGSPNSQVLILVTSNTNSEHDQIIHMLSYVDVLQVLHFNLCRLYPVCGRPQRTNRPFCVFLHPKHFIRWATGPAVAATSRAFSKPSSMVSCTASLHVQNSDSCHGQNMVRYSDSSHNENSYDE